MFHPTTAESKAQDVPLFVEIKAEACEDEGKERHEDSDSDRTAVGGAVGLGVSESNVLSHAQTWQKKTPIIFSQTIGNLNVMNISFRITM